MDLFLLSILWRSSQRMDVVEGGNEFESGDDNESGGDEDSSTGGEDESAGDEEGTFD